MHSNISVSDWECDLEEDILWRDISTQLYILNQKIHRWIKICFRALLAPDIIWIWVSAWLLLPLEWRGTYSAAEDHNTLVCTSHSSSKAGAALPGDNLLMSKRTLGCIIKVLAHLLWIKPSSVWYCIFHDIVLGEQWKEINLCIFNLCIFNF